MTGAATSAEFRRDVNSGNSADRSSESRFGLVKRLRAEGVLK